MKKISLMLVLSIFLVVSASSVVFAVSVNNSDFGLSKEVGTPALTFNFSPGILGQYTTAGTADSQQWFAIATVHTGGTTAYATASNFASMYTKAIAAANQPVTTSNLSTVLGGIPSTEASADTWTGWTKK